MEGMEEREAVYMYKQLKEWTLFHNWEQDTVQEMVKQVDRVNWMEIEEKMF